MAGFSQSIPCRVRSLLSLSFSWRRRSSSCGMSTIKTPHVVITNILQGSGQGQDNPVKIADGRPGATVTPPQNLHVSFGPDGHQAGQRNPLGLDIYRKAASIARYFDDYMELMEKIDNMFRLKGQRLTILVLADGLRSGLLPGSHHHLLIVLFRAIHFFPGDAIRISAFRIAGNKRKDVVRFGLLTR